MAGTLSLTEATFLGTGFELILYGVYICLFVYAIRCLTWRRHTERVKIIYLLSCCILFSCCTIHIFINFRYLYKDLVQAPNPEGALETGTPALRTADALVTFTDFFAELVLIYRMWIIWDHNYYIIIVPLLASFAFIGCAIYTIAILVTHADSALVPPAFVPLGVATFAIPLCFNFIVTLLIVGRLWYRGKQAASLVHGSHFSAPSLNYLRRAMIICIESGVLYLLVQFILTVTFAIKHPSQLIAAAIATQFYGIAPTLIFVRVGQGYSTSDNIFARLSSSSGRFSSVPRSAGFSNGVPSPSFQTRVTSDRVALPSQTESELPTESFEMKGWLPRARETDIYRVPSSA